MIKHNVLISAEHEIYSANKYLNGATWSSGRVSGSELRGPGFDLAGVPGCVLKQDTLTPYSTGLYAGKGGSITT